MERVLEPEWLDRLPPDDPRALRSRRDLRRINRFLGHRKILRRHLLAIHDQLPKRRLVDLGGGDGTFLLRVLQSIGPMRDGGEIIVVDQQKILSPATENAFLKLGWRAGAVRSDIFEWLQQTEPVDCMIANLFLHHFSDARLEHFFRLVAKKTAAFVACEPRRDASAMRACRWLWLLGCSRITREDAAVSVQAGFCDLELSRLWPADARWRCEEGRAGWFSHSFVARRDV